VTDSAKNGVQYCEYLPFGEPLVDQRKTTWNSRYTFSGKERDSETGYSYFGARFYHPDPSIWLSVDPMADQRSWVSPYSYCQNNPIGRVDPTGALDDNYSVDLRGNIKLEEKTNDKFDVIYKKESWDNGKKDNSVTVDKGVISSKKTNSGIGTDGKKYTFDLYTVKGDDKAKEMFEFMATNTKVEWSQTLIGAKKDQKSILSTSHEKYTEAGQGYVLATGYTIRGHNHNHSDNNTPSPSDVNWAKAVNAKFPEAKFQILFKGNYFEYDKQGLIIVPTTLPEIIITPK